MMLSKEIPRSLSRAAIPRAPLLRPPTSRPLTHLHPRRPHLPPLLRPHTPHSPPPTPTISHPRLISAKTRAYLLRESLIAARIVVIGYTAIFASTLLALAGALIYIENVHPTAPSLPKSTRFGVTFARVLQRFTSQTWLAVEVLRDTVQRMEKDWERRGDEWRRGYLSAMRLLAELLEEMDEYKEAKEWYQKILETPREEHDKEWVDIKVAAALRASRIAAFMKDPEGAEEALVAGVECTVPAGQWKEVFPESVDGLKALTELGVWYARTGKEPEALEIFTRVLAARRRVPPPADPSDAKAAEAISDPCAEAVTMAYIGEIMFAMGDRTQGLAWSKEAYSRSEPLAELRAKCKDCALVSAQNIAAMVELMEEAQGGKAGKKSRWSLFPGSTKEEKDSLQEWRENILRIESIRATRGA